MHRLILLLVASALSASAAEPERFEIGFDSIIVPERGAIVTCVLFQGSHVHTFVPPAQMRPLLDGGQKKIVFTGADLDTTMTLQLLDEKPALSSADLDRVRHQLQERYPTGRIIEEGECYTADGKGHCFDIDFDVERILRRARVCLIPTRGGQETVMFVLATSPAHFPGCHLSFMTTVSSFGTRPPR